jgi:hypothetical protein
MENLAVGFYNAYQDEPERLRAFLIERLEQRREAFRNRLHEITNNAKALLLNHEQEQVQEVIRAAASMLSSWAKLNTVVPKLSGHVQDSLMAGIASAYASTIRATVRRDGAWPNLDYSYHLGYGARRVAALSLGKKIEGFAGACEMLLGNPDYVDAVDLIQQAQRVLVASYEELLRKVQLMGQTSFRDELRVDALFWQVCEGEWGQGQGYRGRIEDRNRAWFEATPRQELEQEMQGLIEKEWAIALQRMTALFEG